MSDAFYRLQEALRTPGHLRREEDLDLVQNYSNQIDFFQKLNEEQGSSELHRACCRVMEFRAYSAKEEVFKFGDKGDSFCIILRGSVALLLPKKRKKVPDFLGEAQAEETEDAKEKPRSNDDPQTDDKPSTGRKSGRESGRESRSEVSKSEREPKKAAGDDEPFTFLAKLTAGASFGELALLKDIPRTATAQCLEDTAFAIIKADDFSRLLAAYEEKKLSKKVEFLRNLPFLQHWSKVALFKLSYFFKERAYKLNQVVYRQGSPSSEVFVIRSGEFKVKTKQFSKQAAVQPSKPVDLKVLTSLDQASARRMLKEHRKLTDEKLWMMIKGGNEMFGDYDIMENTPRQQTCVCSTRRAEVYVISKTVGLMQDFLRRMGASSSWTNLKRRHQLETEWLSHREQNLKQLSLKRSTPEPIRQPQEQLYRPSRPSTSLASHKTPVLEAPTESTFFKTEVTEPELPRALTNKDSPDVSLVSLKPGHTVSAARMPRSKSALRVKPRPPPTFFVTASEAVKAKYFTRKRIYETGKLPQRDFNSELKAKIIRVITVRSEEQSRRMTPSRHNLFRRA
jgi:CRP-like cAMP-binding protein